jgi:hypothetical protein
VSVTCGSVQRELFNFLDGDVPADLKQGLEEHLLSCKPCYDRYQQIARFEGYYGWLKQEGVPDELWSKIEKKILEREELVEPERSLAPFVLIPAAIAAVVILAVGLLALLPLLQKVEVKVQGDFFTTGQGTVVHRTGDNEFKLEKGTIHFHFRTQKVGGEVRKVKVVTESASVELLEADLDSVDFEITSVPKATTEIVVGAGTVFVKGIHVPGGELTASSGDTVRLSADRKKEIESLIGSLLNPSLRENSTRKLIEIGADREVEQLLGRGEADLRQRAQLIIRTARTVREFKLAELYKNNPKFVEDLAKVDRGGWAAQIGRANPNLLTAEQKRMFGAELLRSGEVIERLYRIQHGQDVYLIEETWFYLLALGHPDWHIRNVAVAIFTRLAGDPIWAAGSNVVDALAARLDDEHAVIRSSAAYTFRLISQRRPQDLTAKAIQGLQEKIEDPNQSIKMNSIASLVRILDKVDAKALEKMVEVLLGALGGTDRTFYMLAIESLEGGLSQKLGGQLDKAISRVEAALNKEREWSVRSRLQRLISTLKAKKGGF